MSLFLFAVEWSSLIFLCLALLLVVVYVTVSGIFQQRGQSLPLPPGPRGFPVVGVLPLMGGQPHLTVQRWWKQYGDVMSVYMGSRLVVIVSGLEAMKECFIRQGDNFSGRPDNYFKRITKGKGLVFSEGEVWREHRRFTLSCLRNFGMGKVVLEHKIHDEMEYLVRQLAAAAETSQLLDPAPLLSHACGNVICDIIYGTRFDYNDETFSENIHCLSQSVRQQTLISTVNFIPWLEHVLSILPIKRQLRHNVEQRERYAQGQLDTHLKVTPDDVNPRDFMEAYLARMNELKGAGKDTTFDESQLKRAIQDVFIAGTESPATTINWALLFMAVHTDIQLKVQQEIDQSVGAGRLPCMSDRPSLSFTEATLLESQRLGNIALFNVPRSTLQDTTINGFHIPRGTWIFANRWGMHASDCYWTHPEKFDPGRFLDAKGHVHRPEAFTPFGMGPRSCMGETLAKMELFLVFSRLMQSFSVRLPADNTTPSLEPRVGLNLCPQTYKLHFTRR